MADVNQPGVGGAAKSGGGETSFMKLVVHVPLFVILLLAYNLVMWTSNAMENNPDVIRVSLPNRETPMVLTLTDLFVIFGIILLYFEILKAVRSSRITILDHALSLVVFIIFLLEFILVGGAGTASFLILTLLSLLDVVAGFTITISTARRDIALGRDAL